MKSKTVWVCYRWKYSYDDYPGFDPPPTKEFVGVYLEKPKGLNHTTYFLKEVPVLDK